MITLLSLIAFAIVMYILVATGVLFTIAGNMIVMVWLFIFGTRILRAITKRLEDKIDGKGGDK